MTKKLISTHLVSMRFYQSLDPKKWLPSDYHLIEGLSTIKANTNLDILILIHVDTQ